ncbi:hypothetical protein EON64_13945, partial [archaeon]
MYLYLLGILILLQCSLFSVAFISKFAICRSLRYSSLYSMRRTSKIELPSQGIGAKLSIQVLDWTPPGMELDIDNLESLMVDRAYIQASLHADELPGMLVAHHLVRFMDQAACEGRVERPVTIVPYANPLGLQQLLLGCHLGRFSAASGVNFNRDWPDVADAVAERVRGLLGGDSQRNVALVRQAMLRETANSAPLAADKAMKRLLFLRAAAAALVLDLHCDSGRGLEYAPPPLLLPCLTLLPLSYRCRHAHVHARPALARHEGRGAECGGAVHTACTVLGGQSLRREPVRTLGAPERYLPRAPAAPGLPRSHGGAAGQARGSGRSGQISFRRAQGPDRL